VDRPAAACIWACFYVHVVISECRAYAAGMQVTQHRTLCCCGTCMQLRADLHTHVLVCTFMQLTSCAPACATLIRIYVCLVAFGCDLVLCCTRTRACWCARLCS
jgi:hypothetical protein